MPIEPINLARGGNAAGFSPTAEELHTIEARMKDPTFVQLLQEYMQSLEDPETRREEEAYLQQVEREAREGGDYSFDFIFPQPAFVVELMQPTTRRPPASSATRKGIDGSAKELRTFVNICTSDKIDIFREETTDDRRGSHWHVPVSVSQKRTEYFVGTHQQVPCSDGGEGQALAAVTGGDLCYVHDAVFHPQTVSLSHRSARFLCFLVEIAVEHINSGYQESHGFEFQRLADAVPSVGQPKSQTVRKKDGKSPFAVDFNAPVSTQPTKHFAAPDASPQLAASPLPPTGSPPPPTPNAMNAHTTFAKHEEDLLPPVTVLHRGRFNLTDAWQWRVSEQRVGVPEELVVKMTFSGVRSASALEVDITEDGGAVRVGKTPQQTRYGGLMALPFSVEPTPASAKFDRSTAVLTLVLKVIPPAPLGITAEQMIQELAAGTTSVSEAEEAEKPSVVDASTESSAAPVLCGEQPAEAPENPERSPNAAHSAAANTRSSTEPPPILAPPTPGELGCDHERVQRMLALVAEARQAREAAQAVGANTIEPGDLSPAPIDATEAVATPTPEAVDASQETSALMPQVPVVDDPTVATSIHQSDASIQDQAVQELQSRQQAWAEEIRHQMDAAAAARDAEEEAAAQRTAREREKAKKKLEQACAVEASEAKAQSIMSRLPLRNKYIFAID